MIRKIFLFLAMSSLFATVQAIELSLNQARFVPGETLVLTLHEDWSGEADVYVAVTLPANDIFYFLTRPQNFTTEMLPYAEGISASDSKEILQFPFPIGLPIGEYTCYAGATQPTTFDFIGEIAEVSFIYDTEVDLVLGDIHFPDGVIGRRYSLAIEPESGMPPYQFSLSAGTLSTGLTLDGSSGLIQGEPLERGLSEFTVQVIDGNGNMVEHQGAIKVYGILTFGEHGTFKGCNGLQMAFNSLQNLDEIRIEQGTYECNGLEVPSKAFENGIKISGGWDSNFENQNDDPKLTVFDGGAKVVEGIEDRNQCNEVDGIWEKPLCFQEEPLNISILSISTSGTIAIEELSFQNGYAEYGGAIYSSNGKINLRNCFFTGNRVSERGGAVSFRSPASITNSIFNNNDADYGGAIYSRSSIIVTDSSFDNNTSYSSGGVIYSFSSSMTFTNSTFTNNSASTGGVIYSDMSSTTITNSNFTDNHASSGGVLRSYSSSPSYVANSTFTNNSASKDGGVFYFKSSASITNSIFTNNSASKTGGTAYFYYSRASIANSIFSSNNASSGGAIYYYSSSGTITNSTFTYNNASEAGGAFIGSGTILNSVFSQNKADGKANDIIPNGDLQIDYTLVNDISGGVDLGTHFIMGEPRFVDAENGDFHLHTDSPTINMGDSSVLESCEEYDWDTSCREQCSDRYSDECEESCYVCSRYTYPFLRDDNGNVIDLDGNPRIVDSVIDLGAYEFQ